MSEILVRDAIRFAKGSSIHVAGKTFTAEDLRDGLDRLINPPAAPEAVEPAPAAEPVAEPKTKTTKTPSPAPMSDKRKSAGSPVEQL